MPKIKFQVDDPLLERLWTALKPVFGSKVAFARAAMSKTIADIMSNPLVVYDLLAFKDKHDEDLLITGFWGYLVLSGLGKVSKEKVESEVNTGLAAAAITPFAFRSWVASGDSREELMRHWLAYCQQRGFDARYVWATKPTYEWPSSFDAFSCEDKTLHTLLSPGARHWRYKDSFP